MVHAQIRVSGQVQGVGFRPFVYRLANELGLAGWVCNSNAGVEIAVEGGRPQVMRLIERLRSESPALARVERITHDFAEGRAGFTGFAITESRSGKVLTGIVPDRAICPDCLDELFDPQDRRYRHPFINCIHCGPRYTLTARLPYDRANTSMAKFDQCPACQHEYDTPTTRRFHAQPNACPQCGPQLALFDAHWQPVTCDDIIAATVDQLTAGEVVAIKGLGGFHLVCDARNAAAVARLRGGKQREEKPFAVMLLNTASVRQYAQCGEQEAALLETGERPIVLLRKTVLCDEALPGIAPGLSRVGVLLPYKPLHYLLFHEWLGRPAGTDWLARSVPLALVMTSANPGGEPLVKDDDEARASLAGLADAFLTHDRDILHRCDDSVMKCQGEAPVFVRRARGYTPRRIKLPQAGPSVLACGGWLKNTVCLTRGDEAFVSQHIGDLDHAGTRAMLDETVGYLIDLLEVQPQAVAHDLHPDFYSTHYAQRYADMHGLPLTPVQHHHAHIAAVCAEHHITEPVIGLALDGVGLGSDGGVWGGELLQLQGAKFERLGHLAPLVLPGGDRAAREPWRMAASALFTIGCGDEIARRFPAQAGAAMMADMLQRRLNCVETSSMGRLFDAAAGLLGVSQVQAYEGQAAMLLEGLAERHGQVAPLALTGLRATNELDFLPLLAHLADCKDPAYGAALFHATVAAGLCDWVLRASARSGIRHVALGGGCFLNDMLTQSVGDKLRAAGMEVLVSQQLPPNDGALSFGQAAVALQQLNQGA
jgi:hydrogenase maturation protein HypF